MILAITCLQGKHWYGQNWQTGTNQLSDDPPEQIHQRYADNMPSVETTTIAVRSY